MHVLISGAGVAGPTLAFFLARSGITATIVDKLKQEQLKQGQNVDVHGSALSIIKQMGLLDELKRLHTTEIGTRLIGPAGKTVTGLAPEGSALSATAEYEILRGDLSSMLFEASRKEPGVEYHFGTTIDEVVRNSDDEGVEVRLSSDPTQTHRYDVLVAADGLYSNVRKKTFGSEDVTIVDKDMYVVWFTVPSASDDDRWWNLYQALGGRSVSIRPDPHGTHRAMLSLMPRDEEHRQRWKHICRQDRKTQQDFVRQEFADAGWRAARFLDAMADSPDFYVSGVQQIKLASWSKSRVVCLGDAGYAPTPLTGMGSCLAIIGSYVLAGELGRAPTIAEALRSYEGAFRPFVEKTQKVPFIVPRIMHPRTSLERIALQQTLRFVVWLASLLFSGQSRAAVDAVDDFPLPRYSFDLVGPRAKAGQA